MTYQELIDRLVELAADLLAVDEHWAPAEMLMAFASGLIEEYAV